MKTDVIAIFNVAKTIIKNARNFDVETGGILVGTLGNPVTIVAAGEPGKNAIHHSTQFTSDPEADKKCLEDARKIYGNSVMPVGYYHKHLLEFDRPSPGDRQQVLQLKEQYGDGKLVLMGIVNEWPGLIKSKVTLRLYSVDSSDTLLEYDWKLVSSKNKDLLDAINNAPARPDTSNSNFWKDTDFQSYLNPVGRERILQETANLKKAGWQVTTSRHKEDKTLIIDVSNDSGSLQFILPPEFPFNPPVIFTKDGHRFIGLETLTQWNSQYNIADLAAEAVGIMNCNRCKRDFIVV